MSRIEIASSLVYERLLRYRSFYMGFAILSVILYHWFCLFRESPISQFFSRGYVGVDIFFFLSGLGISFSYNRNTLKQFFLNRFFRVLPIYWVAEAIRFTIIGIGGDNYNFSDFVCMLTTASYYGIGELRSNWYISALLAFYISFPIIYKIVCKGRMLAIIVIAIISAVVLFLFHPQWYYDCFIGRFYILCLGIYFYCIKGIMSWYDILSLFSFSIIGSLLSKENFLDMI